MSSSSDKYKALARETLRNQPNDIYAFASLFCVSLLEHRAEHGAVPIDNDVEYRSFKRDLAVSAQANGLLGVPTAEMDESRAAVKIQAAFRGHQVRASKTRRLSHEELGEASGKPAKFEKALSSSQLTADDDAEAEAAAVRIQAGMRGHAQRIKYNQMKAEMTHAATKIQANFRGFQQRKRPTDTPPSIVMSDKQEKQDDAGNDEQAAAVKIQANFKGFKARQELKQEKEAAVKIQSAFRGHQVRKSQLGEANHMTSEDSEDMK